MKYCLSCWSPPWGSPPCRRTSAPGRSGARYQGRRSGCPLGSRLAVEVVVAARQVRREAPWKTSCSSVRQRFTKKAGHHLDFHLPPPVNREGMFDLVADDAVAKNSGLKHLADVGTRALSSLLLLLSLLLSLSLSLSFIPDICHGRHRHVRVNFFWPV